jgi:DNA topoisomerase IA
VQAAREADRRAVRRGVPARLAAQYKSKVKNAQEAHEAIRPAGHPSAAPRRGGELDDRPARLYELIWKRTVASQMADAAGIASRCASRWAGTGRGLPGHGKTIDFPGYLRAYVEGADDPDADLADRERMLPRRRSATCSDLAAGRGPKATRPAAGNR